MTEFFGKVDIKKTSGSISRIKLDGDNGEIILYDSDGKVKMRIGTKPKEAIGEEDHYSFSIPGSGDQNIVDLSSEGLSLMDKEGQTSMDLFADDGLVRIGNDKSGGGYKPGHLILRDNTGEDSIIMNGASNSVVLRNNVGKDTLIIDGAKGNIFVADKNGNTSLAFESTGRWDSNDNRLLVGVLRAGDLRVCAKTGSHSIVLDGHSEQIRLQDSGGRSVTTLDGTTGDIYLTSGSIKLDEGDIILNNADCAEDFDISESEDIEPGTVMVIEEEGKLRQSIKSYDKRVAGIISGAGNCKPGIILDKKHSLENRMPVALMGKVHCKVDAQPSPIDPGDLLTTSYTPGHAMKVTDPVRGFGAIIGKALSPLKTGKGLIPILVTLQ